MKLSEVRHQSMASDKISKVLPLLLFVGCAAAQTPGMSSLLDLPRVKNFSAHRVSSDNRFRRSNDDSKRIMPGETLVMANLTGPGSVNHIWLTVADNEYAWPRLVRLRVYYDGKKTPSVDVPLGDFFGVGHGYDRDLDSLPVRDSSFGRARNSYWPMPFRSSCKITVTDEGNRPVTMFYYHVDWQKLTSLPEDLDYFHAYYRQERPAVSGKNYEFLNVKGSGHYVGTVLNVIQSQVGWFGEGDDLFYVDGAKHPQIYGTGTEDYFNEAWGLRVSFGPWTGTPVAEGERVGARLTGYRWHIPDPIPFTKSLWAGIEHAGWTYNEDGTLRSGFEERPDYFSSTAFWYQKGVNEDLPEPPFGEARLPLVVMPCKSRWRIRSRMSQHKKERLRCRERWTGAVICSSWRPKARDLEWKFRWMFPKRAATRSSLASRKHPITGITSLSWMANRPASIIARPRRRRYLRRVRKCSTDICPKCMSRSTTR